MERKKQCLLVGTRDESPGFAVVLRCVGPPGLEQSRGNATGA